MSLSFKPFSANEQISTIGKKILLYGSVLAATAGPLIIFNGETRSRINNLLFKPAIPHPNNVENALHQSGLPCHTLLKTKETAEGCIVYLEIDPYNATEEDIANIQQTMKTLQIEKLHVLMNNVKDKRVLRELRTMRTIETDAQQEQRDSTLTREEKDAIKKRINFYTDQCYKLHESAIEEGYSDCLVQLVWNVDIAEIDNSDIWDGWPNTFITSVQEAKRLNMTNIERSVLFIGNAPEGDELVDAVRTITDETDERPGIVILKVDGSDRSTKFPR